MKFRKLVAPFLLLLIVSTSHAHASAKLRREAIRTTMAEASIAAMALLQDRANQSSLQPRFITQYDDRSWKLTMNGFVGERIFDLRISGYLWDEDQGDWLITYSGSGSLAEEPIGINGKADWRYDESTSNHRDMDFQHVMRFGEQSYWGWVIGAEIVVGGTLGAAASVAGAAAATGGTALFFTPWIAAAAGVASGSALVSTSGTAKDLLKSDVPTDPPPTPERPPMPAAGERILPTEGTILVIDSRNGMITGIGPGNIQVLAAEYDDDKGVFRGHQLLERVGGITNLQERLTHIEKALEELRTTITFNPVIDRESRKFTINYEKLLAEPAIVSIKVMTVAVGSQGVIALVGPREGVLLSSKSPDPHDDTKGSFDATEALFGVLQGSAVVLPATTGFKFDIIAKLESGLEVTFQIERPSRFEVRHQAPN